MDTSTRGLFRISYGRMLTSRLCGDEVLVQLARKFVSSDHLASSSAVTPEAHIIVMSSDIDEEHYTPAEIGNGSGRQSVHDPRLFE